MNFLKRYKTALKAKGMEFVEKAVEESKKPPNKIKEVHPLTTKQRLGTVLFFLVFLLVGLALSYFTLSWITDGLESKNWPSIEGTIISSEFISTRTSENKPSYSAEILYEYYINDEKYLGNSVTSGGQSSSSSPGLARRLANKYSKGEKANVYYNPNNPEQALLEPGFHAADALPFAIGILFALVGLIGILFSLFGDFSKYSKTN